MRAPAFWQKKKSWQSRLFKPLGAIYAFMTARRLRRTKPQDVGVPVICVGNIGVGGTGKTPVCLALGKLLEKAGVSFFFLNHGYGAKVQNVIVQNGVHTAVDVGDEALLLAAKAPTVVDRKRNRGAVAAVASGAKALIMDDGFQNPSLKKDISFVVIDGAKGLGNECVLPAGPLREPALIGLQRATAVVIVGKDTWGVRSWLEQHNITIPILTGIFLPDIDVLASLQGQEVVAFAGIGHPDKFFDMLSHAGVIVKQKQSFPDHYFYTRFDIEQLLSEAKGRPLVTTEKDFVKIPKDLQKQVIMVGGAFQFEEEETVIKMIQGVMS